MDYKFYRAHLIPALNQGLKISIFLILPSAAGGLLLGILPRSIRTFAPCGNCVLLPSTATAS